MYVSQTSGDVTLLLLSQVRLDLGGQGLIKVAKKTGGKAIDHYNVLTLKLSSLLPRSDWPYTVDSASEPPKSAAIKIKIDKAKMKGRYDGNTITMYFKEGVFERKFNVLAIARQVGLSDGKSIKYKIKAPTLDEAYGGDKNGMIEQEIRGKGFRDLYNKTPDEAIDYLEKQLIEAYTKQISLEKDIEEPSNEHETDL